MPILHYFPHYTIFIRQTRIVAPNLMYFIPTSNSVRTIPILLLSPQKNFWLSRLSIPKHILQ